METTMKDQEIWELLQPGNYSPEKILEYLKLQFPDTYNQDAGVWEKYTLEEHTLMVLRQFEKYYGHKELPGSIEKEKFRLILAVHDIGKPMAIAKGGKHLQHQYTLDLVTPFFEAIQMDERHKYVANTLLSGDPLGPFIRGSVEKAEAVNNIQAIAEKAKLPVADFFELLCIFYKVDAGSYTINAGGQYSLDRLFRFDEENREVDFAEDVEEKIKPLKISF